MGLRRPDYSAMVFDLLVDDLISLDDSRSVAVTEIVDNGETFQISGRVAFDTAALAGEPSTVGELVSAEFGRNWIIGSVTRDGALEPPSYTVTSDDIRAQWETTRGERRVWGP